MKLISGLSSIAVTALVMTGCATGPAQTQTPTVNVSGDWQGEFKCDKGDAGDVGVVVLTLTQTGTSVNGHAAVTNTAQNRSGNYTGTVSGDEFTISTGDLLVNAKVSGDRMAGTFKS